MEMSTQDNGRLLSPPVARCAEDDAKLSSSVREKSRQRELPRRHNRLFSNEQLISIEPYRQSAPRVRQHVREPADDQDLAMPRACQRTQIGTDPRLPCLEEVPGRKIIAQGAMANNVARASTEDGTNRGQVKALYP